MVVQGRSPRRPIDGLSGRGTKMMVGYCYAASTLQRRRIGEGRIEMCRCAWRFRELKERERGNPAKLMLLGLERVAS